MPKGWSHCRQRPTRKQMNILNRETVLKRCSELRIRLDPGNRLQISNDRHRIECRGQGLSILEVFAHPTSVGEAIGKLGTNLPGSQAFVDLVNMIMELHQAGILESIDGRTSPPDPEPAGFGAPQIHVQMLNDRERTAKYIQAIREVVREGDVVVEIGTGTGVLSVAAAQAGARHVYTIEETGIADGAEAVFAANNLQNQITLVRGRSTQVQIPERADVLVSEVIGNEPLAEKVVQYTLDARTRFLKDGARFVPHRLDVYGLPVVVTEEQLARHLFTETTAKQWQDWYGIRFQPLTELSRNSPHPCFIRPRDARRWLSLSAPILLSSYDLAATATPVVRSSAGSVATAQGECNGLLVFFEAQLGPTTRLSTHPEHAGEASSWYSPLWTLPEPISLHRGDRFEVLYKHDGDMGRVLVRRS